MRAKRDLGKGRRKEGKKERETHCYWTSNISCVVQNLLMLLGRRVKKGSG